MLRVLGEQAVAETDRLGADGVLLASNVQIPLSPQTHQAVYKKLMKAESEWKVGDSISRQRGS